MNISELYSAKGLKIKLTYNAPETVFTQGALLSIDVTRKEREFLVTEYASKDDNDNKLTFCHTDRVAAEYLRDLHEGESNGIFKSLFVVEGAGENYIEIQAFVFNSITEYKTPIYIQVPKDVIEKLYIPKAMEQGAENKDKAKLKRLASEYIWDQLGLPALFVMNYKNEKKQRDQVRFVSGRHYLFADNTSRGITIKGETVLRERHEIPVDIYVAPGIEFVEDSDFIQANEEFASDLDAISDPASYFARWKAYNELTKKLIEQEREEFGEISYSGFSEKVDLSTTSYSFNIDKEVDESFVGKNIAVLPNGILTTDERMIRPTPAGIIKEVSGKKIVTYIESSENFAHFPDRGVLVLYSAGDRLITARRDAARERIINHKAPIKYLVGLIEAGASKYNVSSSWESHKAITIELKRNFPKAETLNADQLKAVDIAINTPDIAFIQGPPGTGKTTVIKAICERFREVFEAEEKKKIQEDEEHIIQSPQILISSFQNDAVDNAISTPLPGDLPAYRKLARRAMNSSRRQYQRALDDWYGNLYETIKNTIPDNVAREYISERNALTDEFLSYKNSGELLEKAALLIKHYLSYEAISYPDELVSEAKEIIKAGMQQETEEYIEDPIVSKLEAQLLTLKEYKKDGVRSAKSLLRYLKFWDELEIDESVINNIEAVCKEGFSDDEFSRYVESIEKLKKEYCKSVKKDDAGSKSIINKCITEMRDCFENQYVSQLSELDSQKSIILSEFLLRLEQEYEELVRKYSMTTAATCQTSLDFKEEEKAYDLVVIDEAARANPLDLFIPMSMGKKIIMVGDHKQLPHMLEPDVLQLVKDDPRFTGLPELEKSLFERMFNIFLQGDKPKSVPLTLQYRMHPDICRFVSSSFYDDKLDTPKELKEDPDFRKSPEAINNGRALTLVNIPISHGAEVPGASKSRECEAIEIGKDVRRILDVEVTPDVRIGIITFYSAQVNMIKEHLILNDDEKDRVEIGTVDAFQGKEFDYVLLSCVRSNVARGRENKHEVGFLTKPNRLCVAFSRARKQLAVYGDIETLIQVPCFERLYNICEIEGGGYYREC